MNLFVINRYEGEEKASSGNQDEKSNLSALLKRIEQRKKERALQNKTEDIRPKKRKKAEKCLEIEENDVNKDDDSKNVETVKHDKDKKRKKGLVDVPLRDDKIDDRLGQDDINNVLKVEKEGAVRDRPKRKKGLVDELLSDDEKDDLPGEDDIKNKPETAEEDPVHDSSFIVLGSKSQKKIRAVKRILPDWLAHPEIISADLSSGPSLDSLESALDSRLVDTLKANGITKLFPVQEKTIYWLLKCNNDRKLGWWPRDTCVSAPTGSGKTLAYVLPVLQQLHNRIIPRIRCLVVLPVQELATQVYKVMSTYASCLKLIVGLLSGASSFEQEQQAIVKKTASGEYTTMVDIVIATPGRLVDHILKTPGFSLEHLRFLIIDEADRATDWLQYIPAPHQQPPPLTLANLKSSKIPPAQKLLFSATLSQDPEKLSRLGLFQPILFTSVVVTGKDDDVDLDKETNEFVGRYTSPEGLTELAVECTAEYKPLAVYHLLTKNAPIPKTLIFTNSGETAHRLALLHQSLLSERDILVGELSSQLTPKQREDVLNRFAEGKIHVLVSSDALARGLDVPNVQLVISYDLPKHIKGYIHRVGRTGRAGKPGTAVSVLLGKQQGLFKHMLSTAYKQIPEIEELQLSAITETVNYQTHVDKLRETLEREKAEHLERVKSVKRNHMKREPPNQNDKR